VNAVNHPQDKTGSMYLIDVNRATGREAVSHEAEIARSRIRFERPPRIDE
jgi:hypothetical protein